MICHVPNWFCRVLNKNTFYADRVTVKIIGVLKFLKTVLAPKELTYIKMSARCLQFTARAGIRPGSNIQVHFWAPKTGKNSSLKLLKTTVFYEKLLKT